MNAGGRHLRQHARFYSAAALGAVVWLATAPLDAHLRLLVAGDTFFAAYLMSVAAVLGRSTHATFRARSSRADEGALLIGFLTVVVVALCLASIFALLNHRESASTFRFALSIASVPLGWFMVHTVFAFHYAHRFYANEASGRMHGGLEFPGGEEPQVWDFVYYSFVVGMTAQVSDVSVTTGRMRRLTLAHAIVSFLFNTVIVAIAVNVAVVLAP
jgi:uncharacterized membrane protein